MAMSHILCNVELFRQTRNGHGWFDEELRIEGWFLSHAEIASMAVVFPGQPETALAIDHFRNMSDGVWNHHGDDFGEIARNCRFFMSWEMPAGVEAASGRLRVAMTDGNRFEHPLGQPQTDPPPEVFTDEERALVMTFESLGDNCEFGLMQRRVGIERMSLFRYAGIFDTLALADVVARKFEGFGEGPDVFVTSFGSEWIGNVHSARMNDHTGRLQSKMSYERIDAEERVKLWFLADKIIDDFEAGNRIFVFRTLRRERGGEDGLLGIDELYDAIASYGGAASLLWVTEADERHPHASVDHVRDRLYRGFMRRLARYEDAFTADDRGWVELLTQARAVIGRAHAPAPMAVAD